MTPNKSHSFYTMRRGDLKTYETYKALKEPEFFQRYFIKWFELHEDWISPADQLRNKVQIYTAMGIKAEEVATYQSMVSRSKMIDFIRGKAVISDDLSASILKQFPKQSEKKTPRVTTSRS